MDIYGRFIGRPEDRSPLTYMDISDPMEKLKHLVFHTDTSPIFFEMYPGASCLDLFEKIYEIFAHGLSLIDGDIVLDDLLHIKSRMAAACIHCSIHEHAYRMYRPGRIVKMLGGTLAESRVSVCDRFDVSFSVRHYLGNAICCRRET